MGIDTVKDSMNDAFCISITIMQWRIYMRKVCICEVCDFVSKQNTHTCTHILSFFLSLFLSLYLRGLARLQILGNVKNDFSCTVGIYF